MPRPYWQLKLDMPQEPLLGKPQTLPLYATDPETVLGENVLLDTVKVKVSVKLTGQGDPDRDTVPLGTAMRPVTENWEWSGLKPMVRFRLSLQFPAKV